MAYRNYVGAWLPESGGQQTGTVRGTTATETLTGSLLNDSFDGGGGQDTLIGLTGDDYYWLNNNKQTVVELAAGGIDTIRLWHSMTLPANVENLIVFGHGNHAAGNAMDNIIRGLEGDQYIYGGRGHDVLIGGAGNDTFVIVKGEGADVIQDFQAGAGSGDKVRLQGSSIFTFEQVKASMTQQGADVVLNNGGEALVFRDVTIGEFTADDFQLPISYAALGPAWFAEEFNSLLLVDPAKGTGPGLRPHFGYQGETGVGSYTLPRNGEAQVYVNPLFKGQTSSSLGLNPFSVNNGVLSITAEKVSAQLADQMWGYQFTSGMLTTEWNYAQKYGYFEMRADLPTQSGLWPAFWMVPTDGTPLEIDILEFMGAEPNNIYQAVHSPAVPAAGITNFQPHADGFHTYGVLWDPSNLVFYIDGVETFRMATPADMHKPMYMIVNLAVGGHWAGTPNVPVGWSADMKVDYIRAYGLPGEPPVDPQPEPQPEPEEPPPTGGDPRLFTLPTSGPGIDNVTTSATSYTAPAGIENVTLSGSRQTVTGNELNNIITSNNRINIIDGGAGDDILVAGRDGDTLRGGAGYDIFTYRDVPWNPSRIADFTRGQDIIDLRGMISKFGYQGDDPIADGWLKIEADGAGGARIWFDPDGAGQIHPWMHAVTVTGVAPSSLRAGIDWVALDGQYAPGEPAPTGGEKPELFTLPTVGVDHLATDAVAYTAAAGVENVTLTGSRQTVTGNALDNLIVSNNRINVLNGGAGDDILVSGRDGDTLTGGAGNDIFTFNELPWNGTRITDFTDGVDLIDLRGMVERQGYFGSDPVADRWMKVEADGAGGTRIWFDPDGPDGGDYSYWLVTTVEGVAPSSLTAQEDWYFA